MVDYKRWLAKLKRIKNARSALIILAVCVILTIFLSLDVLLQYASKNAYGSYDYTSSSVVAYVEFMKICISISMLLMKPMQDIKSSVAQLNIKFVLISAVPAAVYAVNNNMVFLILKFLEPAIFQIVSNFKIITTALLMRVVLKKRFTMMHYMCLFLLVITISWTQYIPGGSSGSSSRTIGLVIALVYTVNSSFASVYTEYFLKSYSHVSVHVQNSCLYFWGVLFNFSYWVLVDRDPVKSNFFTGWTPLVWSLILTMSCSGLLISMIMKFANNIGLFPSQQQKQLTQ